jgi:hypothetical protein
MSFDLTGLTDYVDETRPGLIGKVIADPKSAQILDLQTGYKSAGDIHTLDTDVVLQVDACGRTASGTTTLAKRTLTVGAIKVEEDLCPKELNAKYTQHMLKAGSKEDAIPFEKEYTEMKTAKISEVNEVAIWQGDTDSATVNLKRFDGLIKIIDAEGAVIDGNTGNETTKTSANIIKIINAIEAAIPSKLISKGDVAVLLGYDDFRLYTQALVAANLFHYDGAAANMEIFIPGTNVKAIALDGLTGTDRVFAGRIGTQGGFVVGTDLENEEETFDMWYSKDDKIVKFDVSYKLGTQIKFPFEIVEFTLVV